MLALNRQLIKANARVTQGNSLSGLVGFDMHGKTVGVIGTGKIGRGVASILPEWGAKCWRTTCGPRRKPSAAESGTSTPSRNSFRDAVLSRFTAL